VLDKEGLLFDVHVVREDRKARAVGAKILRVRQAANDLGQERQADWAVKSIGVVARVLDVAEHLPCAHWQAELVSGHASDSVDHRLAEPDGPAR